jgi:hypothetical protein
VSLAYCSLGCCLVHFGMEFDQNSVSDDAIHVAVCGEEHKDTKVP